MSNLLFLGVSLPKQNRIPPRQNTERPMDIIFVDDFQTLTGLAAISL
mgnify:CR=1 FL=1